MLVQIDLLQHGDRFAFFQMGDDFALEAGLAAGIDVGQDFRRAGRERDGRLVDGFDRGGLVLLLFDGGRARGPVPPSARG